MLEPGWCLLDQGARSEFSADQILDIQPICRLPDDPRLNSLVMPHKLIERYDSLFYQKAENNIYYIFAIMRRLSILGVRIALIAKIIPAS